MLDLLLTDARILTQDDARPVARTVGVWRGFVVGLDDDVANLPARRTVDLDGAVVTPGFGDAHNHMLWFGLSLDEVALTGLRRLGDVYDRVAERAARLPAGAWVIGSGYDHTLLGGHPDRAALDRAGGGRPVWLKHVSGHQAVVSSAVLERAGVLDGTAEVPDGGVVVRDVDGAPTGVLQENAQALAADQHDGFGIDEMAEALGRAASVYASEGLTHVVECGVGGGLVGRSAVEALAYQVARESGLLDVRVDLMPTADVLHGRPDAPGGWDGVGLDLGLRTGFGDDRLRLGAVKAWLDGSLIGRTAAMREPFCDHGHGSGFLTVDPADMTETLLRAHVAGWQIAAHAIGDKAIDLALDIFEEAQRRLPRPDARHRIEHAAVTSSDQINRMAAVSAVPVPQPRFLYEIGDTMAAALGPARTDQMYRHRSFLEAGLRVPSSSDRPVAAGAPLLAMQSMVERLSRDGHLLAPDERVDAATALRACTADEAWVCHDEDRRGVLRPGALADLVVLDDDPTVVPSSAIGGITVLATLLGGELTHGEL